MHITAVYTLLFSMRCTGTEQHNTAIGIIKNGATSLDVTANISALPMPEGEDTMVRNSKVTVNANSNDTCELYWNEVSRALAFIGVEVVSP